jgi:enhancing lycopene biosynthesis protein 2
MAMRVGVILSGCGSQDGSEIHEAVLVLHMLERLGARAVCLAPATSQAKVVDHLTGTPDATTGTPRRVLSEAARIARGAIRDLATAREEELDALILPGGRGVATVLSDYADKGVVCEVNPDVSRLLKGMLTRHRPMGFICLAPILAARVLGPLAGIRLTLGTKSCEPAKHAAIMGADVRHCPLRETVVDEKNRVVSTPAYMYDEARILDVGIGIDHLVRSVVSMGRQRQARPAPSAPAKPAQPRKAPPANGVLIRKPKKTQERATRPGGGSS